MQTIAVDELDDLEKELELDWHKIPDPLCPLGGKCAATGTCDGPGTHPTILAYAFEDWKNLVTSEISVSHYFDSKNAFDLKKAIDGSLKKS